MHTLFMKRAVWGAVGVATVLLAGAALAVPVTVQGTWERTIKGRDIDGNPVDQLSPSAVFLYDTRLHVTWLRDANVIGGGSWDRANTWASQLKVGRYDDWRLPTVRPVNGEAFQYGFSNNGSTDDGSAKTGVGWGRANEMGHLYYVTLGNKGYCTPNDAAPESCIEQPGWGRSNSGAFQNFPIANAWYWSGSDHAPPPDYRWMFRMGDGLTDVGQVVPWGGSFAMAVRPGDVAAVPEPQTYAMLLLGLTGLTVAMRRRPN